MMYTFFILLLSFTLVSTNPVSIDTGRNPIDALSSQTDNANILLGDDSDDRIDVSDATMNSPELTDPSDGVPHSSEEASNLLLASYTPNEVPDIPAFSSNEAPSPLPVQSNSQLTEAIPVELQAGAGGCSSRGTKKKRQLSADARFCPSGVSSQYNQGGDQSQERSNDENASNSKPSPSNSYENNVVNIKRKRKKPSCGEKIPVCCQENPVQAVTVGDHTYFNYAICVSWALDEKLCLDPRHEKCCKPYINFGETLRPPSNSIHHWSVEIMTHQDSGWAERCTVPLP